MSSPARAWSWACFSRRITSSFNDASTWRFAVMFKRRSAHAVDSSGVLTFMSCLEWIWACQPALRRADFCLCDFIFCLSYGIQGQLQWGCNWFHLSCLEDSRKNSVEVWRGRVTTECVSNLSGWGKWSRLADGNARRAHGRALKYHSIHLEENSIEEKEKIGGARKEDNFEPRSIRRKVN